MVHTFWQNFTKKSFKVNYWIHYHVWRSSHFSCFDAFVRTFINLWKLKKKRMSEGEFPLQKLKNLQFSSSISAYLLPAFYWKPFFIFNKILTIFVSIPPTFLVLMPLLGIINFWPLKKMRVSEGELPLRSWKKMQFWNSICKIWCISFANILLKIHYSFPMKYWLLLCLFLPPFHFFKWYWLLSCLFL